MKVFPMFSATIGRAELEHLDCLLARSVEIGAPCSTLVHICRILKLAGVDPHAGTFVPTRDGAVRYGATIVQALERLGHEHARTAVWLADWPPDTIDRVIALVRGECPILARPAHDGSGFQP